MSLEEEVRVARTEIVSDGYDMSFGEIINLYRDNEIIISPDFQRLFRWDISRKTAFVESLLLGIPIPPIFVFQNDDGVWELIDGLQRLSTIFEFVGVLRSADGELAAASVLLGTRFLPSLSESTWANTPNSDSGIGQALQLQIKRARVRVEILKQESDPTAKYELFQRLNTGGANLSPQEVRNCVAVMLNKPFFEWLKECSGDENFLNTIDQTEFALEKQVAIELTLRFFAFRNVPYVTGLDVHEYLDEALMVLATDPLFNWGEEARVFHETFKVLNNAMGTASFKKWDGETFKGKFLMSVFEVVSSGVSKRLEEIARLPEPSVFIKSRCKNLWSEPVFILNSGAGVRGTTRLSNLLPIAEDFFLPR